MKTPIQNQRSLFSEQISSYVIKGLKGIVFLTLMISFFSCAEDDLGSDNENYLKIVEINPEEGTNVDESTILRAKLAYNITKAEPWYEGYQITIYFDGINGKRFTVGGTKAVTEKKDTILFNYPLKNILTLDSLASPLTVTYNLSHTKLDKTTIVLDITREVFYNVVQ